MQVYLLIQKQLNHFFSDGRSMMPSICILSVSYFHSKISNLKNCISIPLAHEVKISYNVII